MNTYNVKTLNDLFVYFEKQSVNIFVSPLNIDNLHFFFKGIYYAGKVHNAETDSFFKELKEFENYLNNKYFKLEYPKEWRVSIIDLCPERSKQIEWLFKEWKEFRDSM